MGILEALIEKKPKKDENLEKLKQETKLGIEVEKGDTFHLPGEISKGGYKRLKKILRNKTDIEVATEPGTFGKTKIFYNKGLPVAEMTEDKLTALQGQTHKKSYETILTVLINDSYRQ